MEQLTNDDLENLDCAVCGSGPDIEVASQHGNKVELLCTGCNDTWESTVEDILGEPAELTIFEVR